MRRPLHAPRWLLLLLLPVSCRGPQPRVLNESEVPRQEPQSAGEVFVGSVQGRLSWQEEGEIYEVFLVPAVSEWSEFVQEWTGVEDRATVERFEALLDGEQESGVLRTSSLVDGSFRFREVPPGEYHAIASFGILKTHVHGDPIAMLIDRNYAYLQVQEGRESFASMEYIRSPFAIRPSRQELASQCRVVGRLERPEDSELVRSVVYAVPANDAWEGLVLRWSGASVLGSHVLDDLERAVEKRRAYKFQTTSKGEFVLSNRLAPGSYHLLSYDRLVMERHAQGHTSVSGRQIATISPLGGQELQVQLTPCPLD